MENRNSSIICSVTGPGRRLYMQDAHGSQTDRDYRRRPRSADDADGPIRLTLTGKNKIVRESIRPLLRSGP